jgi:hypothetical protein
MRWVVYDPQYLTDHPVKFTGMANNQVVCAECGLEGWDDECAECGGGPGVQSGSPEFVTAVMKRAARKKLERDGEEGLSMHTGQHSTSSPTGRSANRPDAGSTLTPPVGSDRDTLSTVIRHLAGGDAAVFTGSEPAASLGRFFVVLGWIVVGLSVIGGIALMATTESTGYGNEHPNVLLGVAVMASGSIQGFVLVMIGSFVQATLEFQSLVGGFFKRLKTLPL